MPVGMKTDESFNPLGVDTLSADRIVSEANLLPNLIEQLGLVIHVEFLPEAVAILVTTFRLDKDLADDKERYATQVAEKITPFVSSTYSYAITRSYRDYQG